MVVKHEADGRFWSICVLERLSRDAEVIFTKDKNRVVIKMHGVDIIVENMSTKELNNE